MATQRIYVIRTKGSEDDLVETSLVRASHKSAALRHVAEECFVASVATQEELVDFVSKGLAVQDAGEEKPE